MPGQAALEAMDRNSLENLLSHGLGEFLTASNFLLVKGSAEAKLLEKAARLEKELEQKDLQLHQAAKRETALNQELGSLRQSEKETKKLLFSKGKEALQLEAKILPLRNKIIELEEQAEGTQVKMTKLEERATNQEVQLGKVEEELAQQIELLKKTEAELTEDAADAYGEGFGDALAQEGKCSLEDYKSSLLTHNHRSPRLHVITRARGHRWRFFARKVIGGESSRGRSSVESLRARGHRWRFFARKVIGGDSSRGRSSVESLRAEGHRWRVFAREDIGGESSRERTSVGSLRARGHRWKVIARCRVVRREVGPRLPAEGTRHARHVYKKCWFRTVTSECWHAQETLAVVLFRAVVGMHKRQQWSYCSEQWLACTRDNRGRAVQRNVHSGSCRREWQQHTWTSMLGFKNPLRGGEERWSGPRVKE
ncbi:hypothetical protein VNO80_03160 [Phaseolus coccineus]|uniref:Uncharacterized protein n=1 Tax=Phaseolus coccineus TaxID=3886 RepID=A0AAN9NQT1_PHACN